MTKTLNKKQCEKLLIKAVELCNKNGFKVYCASDDEGNSFNLLETEYLIFEGSNNGSIVIGTCGYIDSEEIFE